MVSKFRIAERLGMKQGMSAMRTLIQVSSDEVIHT